MTIRLPTALRRKKPIIDAPEGGAAPADGSPPGEVAADAPSTGDGAAAHADPAVDAQPDASEGSPAEGEPLMERTSTGIAGLDANLGGGIVRRSVVLFTGRPGAGLNALLMEAAVNLARGGAEVLYAASMESGEALHARFAAVAPELPPPTLVLLTSADAETAFRMAGTTRSAVLILEDLQGFTVATAPKAGGGERKVKGGPGTVTQAKALMDRARATARAEDGPAVLILAHTDGGSSAALKAVEHEADARLRMVAHGETSALRTIANRFGPSRQVTTFAVRDGRLVEVDTPDTAEAVDGTSPHPEAGEGGAPRKRVPLPSEPATLAAAYEVVDLRHEVPEERAAVAEAHRKLTGSETPAEAEARALAAIDWAVRVAGPAALNAIGQPERAATLAELAQVVDVDTATPARTTARDAARHAREVAERDGLDNTAFYVLRSAADAAKALVTGAGPVEAVRHATEAAVHASRMGAAALPDLILALLRA